jgi:hypothetical protein
VIITLSSSLICTTPLTNVGAVTDSDEELGAIGPRNKRQRAIMSESSNEEVDSGGSSEDEEEGSRPIKRRKE